MGAKIQQRKAWAVDTNSTQAHGYLGIYAFDPWTKKAPWQEGCTIALFRTRDEARAELKRVHKECSGYFPKATVRRVIVTVTPVKSKL